MEKPTSSRWQITLKLDRGNGKTYVKQISSRSTKMFIYVTFVAALWTTSAYIFFYINDKPEAQTMKAMQYLNELAQIEAPVDSESPETKPLNTQPSAKPENNIPAAETKAPVLEALKITEGSASDFVLENTDIKVLAGTATVRMSLRKTTSKPEIEGKMAGILVLRDSASGIEHRVSSRPGFIPLVPEQTDVETRGLYFRAKHSVRKQLVFNLPENTVFDEVRAELSIITKGGDLKKLEVKTKNDVAQNPVKTGNSGVQAPSLR